MIVETQLTINAPSEAIWKAIADIENSPKIITGIQKLEVLEKPASGLVGLKWRETRLMFGKAAECVMWVTDAIENESYTKRAEQDGCVFLSTYRITKAGDSCVLTSRHETQPLTFPRRLLLPLFAVMLKGILRKAMTKDLEEIKAALELGKLTGLASEG